MLERSRMPQLAFPFAVVGAAGGWLSAGFLANPIVGLSNGGGHEVAAISAAACAAALGAGLTRWCREGAGWTPREATWLRVALGCALSGAVVGGTVGALAGNHLWIGAVANGMLSGLAFAPICAVVVAAAQRAERARLGSIVAGSDQRAVWGILVTTLALATMPAALDWVAKDRFRAFLFVPQPLEAIGMAIGAGALLAALLVADLAALLRIRRVEADPQFEAHDEPVPEGVVPEVDLGLGDALRARLAQGSDAYRSRPRPVALLRGDAVEAREALRGAIRRGIAGLAIVGASLALHAAAAGVTWPSAFG